MRPKSNVTVGKYHILFTGIAIIWLKNTAGNWVPPCVPFILYIITRRFCSIPFTILFYHFSLPLPGNISTRRFACPFCGKCVRSKENLKLHVRKHTGERPFVCLFCGRAFGGKSDLTRHLRIHTGERPYHCEACGKCFARADYLSKHLTTHVHNSPRWNEGRRRRFLHHR